MLVSVLILAAMLLGFALLGAFVSLERGRSGMSLEQKFMAKASAASCMEMALQGLGNDHAYQGNQSMSFGGVDCHIRPIYQQFGVWVVEIEASSGNQVYRIKTILSKLDPVTIKSWLEVPNF